MLWPFILPLQITLWLFAGFVVVATAIALLFRWRRTKTLRIATVMASVAFVPTCAEIKSIVDARRFGEFYIPTFDSVTDEWVERFLPPAARGITFEKTPMGYRARFTITQAELDQWFDGVWAQFGEDSVRPRDTNLKVSREFTGTIFEGRGWKFPNDLIEYVGPAAANGAGFTIWYDAQTETAFQRGGYW